MLSHTAAEYDKVSFDENFKSHERKDLKEAYNSKLDGENKVLRLDKANQFRFAMTKALTTGCIKENTLPTQEEFNYLLEKVETFEDEIGDLLVVDFEFNAKQVTPKQLYYNEMYNPIF